MLGIKPFTGKAARAYAAPLARINIWDGSVRSGKTINSIYAWCKFVRQGPPGLLMMVGRTEQTCRQNVIDPILEIFGKHARYVRPYLYLFGRKIVVVGANDMRAEGKIRGVTLAGAYVDEVTLIPESFFTMLLSRLSVEGAALIGTTNPDTPTHWLNKKFFKREKYLSLHRWHFTLHDNPHLPASYIEEIEKEYVGLWRRRFILGEWVVAEGAIYDMLDPARHLVQRLPWDLREIGQVPVSVAGGDYGTTNPTSFLVLSAGPDKLYVHHEYRYDSSEAGSQKTDADYSHDYLAWKKAHAHPLQYFFVDPAAASFILQVWRDGEKRVTPANNDVRDGLREVATLLGADLLAFHEPTTEHVWEEMVGYVWDPTAQERGEDAPMKVNDHGPDALRYAVRGFRNTWTRYLKKETSGAAA